MGAPHGLKDCRASDAKSTNVRTADVDRRLICEHVRKPLYGPRPLIFDRTTSTVEANSLRHPQGDPAIATVFGRKLPANSPHGGRMPNVTRALCVKLPRLFTVYLSMGCGRNRFLNLCARVWYFLHSGTEFSSWNSPEARSKMKSLSPRVRNIIYIPTFRAPPPPPPPEVILKTLLRLSCYTHKA